MTLLRAPRGKRLGKLDQLLLQRTAIQRMRSGQSGRSPDRLRRTPATAAAHARSRQLGAMPTPSRPAIQKFTAQPGELSRIVGVC
ncbi:hypothetical protein I552_6818 [Mycobacterium xenopi 3993]|nr:hypothetical protein I552_6818 [Mycobacterium xenopi 3993]